MATEGVSFCVLSSAQERSGALGKFLNQMAEAAPDERYWNVSLFHYRNHGADIGRVLVGMQVPEEEMGEFEEFLDNLGYVFHEESKNEVYAQFLR